jgi:predicted nuclease of restriction endonuclease-like (RecB) superfamily
MLDGAAMTKSIRKRQAKSEQERSIVSVQDKTALENSATSTLYEQVREILDAARSRAARSVNSEMVRAYWQIGAAIVEHEQAGKERADYGARLLESLAARLKADKLKGFSVRNLYWMREFYEKFPILHALRAELSWTHYRLLLKVEKSAAREWYETEAATQNWSTRELERQINSLLWERAALSTQKRGMIKKERDQSEKYAPSDFVKDPFVLEFLGLKESPELSELEIESALLEHLQEFLLELGRGFSFVARQQRITLDGDHFYIDLVFYNRLLKCFVLIDLKIGKLTHQDLGQMQLYTNFYTREMREEWENPAIGILLCADKNEAVVRYTLPEGEDKIFAARYRLQLPSEDELAAELCREQELLAHHLAAANDEI